MRGGWGILLLLAASCGKKDDPAKDGAGGYVEPRRPYGEKLPPAGSTALVASAEAPPWGSPRTTKRHAPLAAADAAHVDLLDVIVQARSAATALRPGAQLMTFIAYNVRGGTLDLAPGHGDGKAVLHFEHIATVAGQPPGKDKQASAVDVRVTSWGVDAALDPEASAGYLDGVGIHAIDGLRCSSLDAWKTAQQKGMPSDAVAQVTVWDDTPTAIPPKPARFTWSIDVPGHAEHHHWVDAVDCKLVR